MMMETLLNKCDFFSDLTIETVLFESSYPILFTALSHGKVYLFICHAADEQGFKWIAAETSYQNLIEMLENKITLRDAFLGVTDIKYSIDYSKGTTNCKKYLKVDIPDYILPAEGAYMDSEDGEFEEELKLFREKHAVSDRKIIDLYGKVSFNITPICLKAVTSSFDCHKNLLNQVIKAMPLTEEIKCNTFKFFSLMEYISTVNMFFKRQSKKEVKFYEEKIITQRS